LRDNVDNITMKTSTDCSNASKHNRIS